MLARPLLPKAEAILPYLKKLDETRVYTNFGNLNNEYCARLEELFGSPVVTACSATSALTATIMACDLPKNSHIAMPSWTFPATAAAVVNAGHIPYFVDVQSETHQLTWGVTTAAAVIVVAPFGAPANVGGWDEFSRISKKPVIIDAAAGFDAFSTICKPAKCPVIISTHSTKSFGTGEGGFVTCHDKPLLEKIRRITNFGLTSDRRIEYNGLNAKFSEYHAAVGLAELDGWSEKRKRILAETQKYGLNYATSQIAVREGEGRKGVYGCHIHNAYADYPRTPLPVTEDLIENIRCVTVGL